MPEMPFRFMYKKHILIFSPNYGARDCSVCLNYYRITLSLQDLELPHLTQGCVDVGFIPATFNRQNYVHLDHLSSA